MIEYSLKPLSKSDETKLKKYPPLIRRLLLLRGIKTNKDAEIFLHPDYERDVHDPYLMKDMKKVVRRIFKAINEKEKIAIWSDYDMDGIPGAVVLYDFFQKIGYTNIIHHTPHRNEEGFGLNKDGIQELQKDGVSLIITVDCGTADTEEVKYATSKKVDVIVTDHHIPNKKLPKAYAILNPKQEDCEYPGKMLSGAGVSFKLVQALAIKARKLKLENSPVEGWEKWALDLVGMATVADMVPLTGENRALAHFGIFVLKKSRRLGLQALFRNARTNQRFATEDDISFTVAPRINAASRMGHARDAFKLLSSTDMTEAGVMAKELDSINNKRKTLVAVMKRETNKKISKRGDLKSVIVLGNPEWKPSLLGLVASSVAEEYKRPVFLWGRENGNTIKGSCRSDGVTNVFELMDSAKDCFIEYGGHAFSGGFSLEEEKIHTLESTLDEIVKKGNKSKSEEKKFYDEKLDINNFNWDLYREVEKLSPYGVSNDKPVFLIPNVKLAYIKTFGKGKEHIELGLEKDDGSNVKAIRFFSKQDSFSCEFHENTVINVIANIEVSHFLGRKELRLRLVDVLSSA